MDDIKQVYVVTQIIGNMFSVDKGYQKIEPAFAFRSADDHWMMSVWVPKLGTINVDSRTVFDHKPSLKEITYVKKLLLQELISKKKSEMKSIQDKINLYQHELTLL